MDPKLQNATFRAALFGDRVATEHISPEAITSVSERVYSDLGTTLHGIRPREARKPFVEDTHASLCQFVTDLETDPLITHDVKVAQENFDARHDTWCSSRISAFIAFSHVPPGQTPAFTYGHAQKWINTTLKYLAFLGNPAVLSAYRYLHVPVDYTEALHPADVIGVPRPPGKVSSSKLNRNQYRDYHQQLRAAIDSNSDGSLAPLDWEAQALIARSSS